MRLFEFKNKHLNLHPICLPFPVHILKIEEWILERQATLTAQFVATDATLQEQKAVQKYHLFRNFEAEVKSYGLLASEIFQVPS